MTASTVSVAASTRRFGRKASHVGLCGNPFTASVATTSIDEQDDIIELGYVPAGVTVVGFIVKATDLDTGGSPALVQKLTLGSTDLVTGITVGQSGISGFYGCVPTATTAATKLQIHTTTAAATPASGTVYVTPIYFST
jgi:hypothetical protein